ncbi:dephospho-CoA kinase [Nonlabens spongiae]|uniref:Dephospho-CoA kinase n=1 Tax=Nonlabens spongiae TaxID=331648 RepID=A0A1W6MJR8_9FLAO|nr:dephospho-CoA kinase [Nonlabens spongiae]ARN77822.1 dephospho-CoA kinase [Nonlabens spongiae]
MKVLGITGGIGSGKSTIAKELVRFGIPVFVADEESKKLLSGNEEIREKVKSLLGEQAYIATEGTEIPNRKYIASKVFTDKQLLSELNSIMHPAVRQEFQTWKGVQQSSYVAYEAAILLETEGRKICDQILLVTAPLEMRIERVMARDQVNRQEVLQRMSKQSSEFDKLLLSDLVICNIKLTESTREVRFINDFMLKY